MKISKKILAVALSVMLLLSVMPFAAFAADNGLQALVDAAANNSTIKLTEDYNESSYINVSGKKITIDLNGYDVTFSSSIGFVVRSDATLIIEDTAATTDVAVDAANDYAVSNIPDGSINVLGGYAIYNLGKAYIYSGAIYGDSVIYCNTNSTTTISGKKAYLWAQDGAIVAASTGATVNVTNAVIESADNGVIMTNGNATCNNNTITVNSGTLIGRIQTPGYIAMGIYQPSNNTLNIKGGTIVAINGAGIVTRGGTTNITGGTIISSGNITGKAGDGSNAIGCNAVVVDTAVNYPAAASTEVAISGGTFESEEAPLDVKEGTVQLEEKVNVTGGTFTEDGTPATIDADYLAPGATMDAEGNVAQTTVAMIGETAYPTLVAAVEAAQDGDTIDLVYDYNGDGVVVPQGKFQPNGLTIDFHGYTYKVTGTLVGSPGTKTLGFQLLRDNNITFQNGTITSTKASMLVQNYSNLTLENMNLTFSRYRGYTLSNNNGDVVIDNSTITNSSSSGYAFDVCRYASYPSVSVTVKGDSVINGNVEVSASNNEAKDGFSLTLESGEITGNIKVDASAKAAMEAAPEITEIVKSADFEQAAPEGYKWVEDGEGNSELAICYYVAQVGDVKYEDFNEALAAISTVTSSTHTNGIAYNTYVANGTIKLLDNVTGDGFIIGSGSNLTIDFNGKTYDIEGQLVGSNKTEYNGLQLLKDSDITFKNGTLTSDIAYFLVQNYSNLTLQNMTLNLKGNYNYQYTLSNNNGTTVIEDSTINAADYSGQSASDFGSFAFDVCRYSTYDSVSVTVKGDSTINGDVEVSATGSNAKDGLELNLEGGELTGAIVLDATAEAAIAATPEKAEVAKAPEFSQSAPNGYRWADDGEGSQVLTKVNTNGQNLTVEAGMEYNAYIDAAAYGVEADGVFEITYNANSNINQNPQTVTKTIRVSAAEKYNDPQSIYNGTYKFAVDVAPAQIDEVMTIKLYTDYTKSECLFETETSVKALCEKTIATSEDENFVKLCKAILDYGKAAQDYFGYNQSIASYQQAEMGTLTKDDIVRTAASYDSGLKFCGFSFVVKSKLVVNLLCKAENIEVISIDAEDNLTAEVTDKGNFRQISVSGINPENINKPFTVHTNVGDITIGANNIARSIIATSSNPAEVNLAKAIYLYGVAADLCF